MSNLTDYGENKLVDMLRGEGLTLPASWRVVALSAANDAAVTEVSGSGVVRAAVARTLDNWAGTQAIGSTLASSGSSKTTSNNLLIDMGTATTSVGTITHVGLFDAASGGNCWMYSPLHTPIVTSNGVAVQIPIGQLTFSLSASGSMRDYLVNKLIDLIFRGEAYSYPSSVFLGAMKTTDDEVGGGVGYERFELVCSMDELSGTQSSGTTSASSGTSGRTSNNNVIQFASPTSSWGDIDRLPVFDAGSGGNELWRQALAATKSIAPGFALTFQPNNLAFTLA